MAERRVVVTGVGAASPLGIGFNAFREGLLSGRHGIGPITRFDPSKVDVRTAGEVSDYSDELLPSDPRHHVVLSRPMQLGLVAAAECIESAGLDARPEIRSRTACLMALSRWDINLPDFGESFARSMEPDETMPSGFRFNRRHYVSRGSRAIHPLWLLKFIPNLAVAHLVRTFGLQGEANTYTSEAAASIQLLGHAAQSIREGRYDVALCGGSDGRITPIGLARYLSLGLLASSGSGDVPVSMPFDENRSGYVLGEGATFLVLEELGHAERRNARPLAEILGWGDGSDAYHPYLAHPEGRGLRRAMSTAIETAGIDARDVDCIVATACSLVDLDSAEACAIQSVFGDAEPAVTAPAGAIGRTHVAVGSFAVATALTALSAQAVPPTAGTSSPAANAPRGLVIGNDSLKMHVGTVMANAYSFGGQCASIVLGEAGQ